MLESNRPVRLAALVSGHSRGSNLQAIAAACKSGEIAAEMALVIGTRADAPALERAREAGAHVTVISPRRFEGEEERYGSALLKALRAHDTDIICLCGYMLRLPQAVIKSFPNKTLNVHPALLPLFGGKGMFGENVHQAVLESGMKVTGCTVHLADEEYDTGPILVQRTVEVEDNDTPQSLAAKVLPEEHRAYVQALKMLISGRLHREGRRVTMIQGDEK